MYKKHLSFKEMIDYKENKNLKSNFKKNLILHHHQLIKIFYVNNSLI